MRKITVKVPATSANLGPGFDVLGLALELYNEVEIEQTAPPDGLLFKIEGEGEFVLPKDKTNIVYRAVGKIFDRAGEKIPPLQIKSLNRIPLARGLGSSSAAIIGGMVGANELLGRKLTWEEILEEALFLEGHPDNLVPALVGGLCICYKAVVGQDFSLAKNELSAGQLKYLKIVKLPKWKAVVCIPDFEISTVMARKILPEKVLRKDAVFNLSRMALLIDAFLSGDKKLLRVAMEDRLHQSERAKLIPGMEDAFIAARESEALAVALSGSGPTIIAFTDNDSQTEKIGLAMQRAFVLHDVKSRFIVLDIAKQGARIL